ncbi:hypothetical protein N474_15740 [Pseudoalteromonas luteoviolacea CPMOR-2]|uniref:Amidohydrolase-related domain-containing protein n=1 Tax=Pseudoalteromonas luteoviolacea DSM 6061 TaxID=1365250 RepID=A0A166YM94_9GAMM|nr:amidohydrolase family protein [Pseudoalteromonas luteoviolacea]KZN43013.1 hypothetical protein N475_00100 [Pseudoalteromonas luteoviolacea DSM 6061]KZN55429.1 hypothetical protein N474_15740 [Pseudoalteromonas luteoviolacea CPMOR-2]MBE0385519.1 hypothetical protein [Pseudoalteromonas luteoviolacea DSM 6061]
MRNNTLIVDMDRHVNEPPNLFTTYLSKKEQALYLPTVKSMAPEGETFSERLTRLDEYACFPAPDQIMINDSPLWQAMSEKVTIELNIQQQSRSADIESATFAQGHLDDMNRKNIDISVLLPNHGSYYVYNDNIDAIQSAAYAKAYNRWLKDLSSVNTDRLHGAALISRHDPQKMVADVIEAHNQGFTSVALQSSPVKGIPLESKAYFPFWRACEEREISIIFHSFTHSNVPILGSNLYESRFGKFSCSHIMEAMSGILSLMTSGTLEHFPKLKFAFLEAGCGWLPHWLWRLDELAYPSLKNEVKENIKQLPSEYFERQIWLAIEPDELMLKESIQHIGAHKLLFGSDFPHMDHESDNIQEVQKLENQIGKGSVDKILGLNALDFFGESYKSSLDLSKFMKA